MACRRQVRLGPSGVVGMDFTAVLALAAAMGCEGWLIPELLIEIEPLVLDAYEAEGGD